MTTKEKLSFGAIVVVVTIIAQFVGGWAVQKLNVPAMPSFGTVGNLLAENYDPYLRYNQGYYSNLPVKTSDLLESTGTFQVGSSGTAQANQITTTCSPKADVSIAATSTGYAYCTGVTGVTSSDNVLAQFATSTVGLKVAADDFWVVSAKASSTAGSIDLVIYNGSGKNAAPSAVGQAASTTVIHASH